MARDDASRTGGAYLLKTLGWDQSDVERLVVEWQRDPCAERIARDENIEVSAVLAIVRYLRVVRMVPLRHKRRRMPFIELDIERLREIAEKANDTKATS